MDEIKTVDDLLKAKNVTPEEYECLKDFIETAKANEREIREYACRMRSNFDRLSQALNKALQDLLDASETFQLRLMSSDKFYRE